MKKFILSAAIVALTTVAFAQNNDSETTPQQQTQATAAQDSSTTTPVKMEDLPEAVKTTLASEAYKAWTPTEAFLVKENGNEFYQINVTKDDEKGSVKIKADGTPAS
ncbi:hypothetical protein BCY91_08380 [Pelobium manganitolerans]|uniref:PepSY domain-containing protein n=1 Tax=Pelobium manganitolerans TaxID=1842495 RepID=A0A419S487_9SPHI|nr:hypothetical protein [Pelobium manganitolerans]RKD14477.1 hypothetical protein BCY91_08380 [Pelobium manganitolerans]